MILFKKLLNHNSYLKQYHPSQIKTFNQQLRIVDNEDNNIDVLDKVTAHKI